MTIYEIKRLTSQSAPHFFSRRTMKSFNQTLKDFKVYKHQDGRYLITAPGKNYQGKVVGYTQRYFNPTTNNLEFVD